MEDLLNEVVLVRGSDGWAYEGKLDGVVASGLISRLRLTEARLINWDDETTDPPTIESVAIDGPVYIPEHLVTWIHRSHLGPRKKGKR